MLLPDCGSAAAADNQDKLQRWRQRVYCILKRLDFYCATPPTNALLMKTSSGVNDCHSLSLPNTLRWWISSIQCAVRAPKFNSPPQNLGQTLAVNWRMCSWPTLTSTASSIVNSKNGARRCGNEQRENELNAGHHITECELFQIETPKNWIAENSKYFATSIIEAYFESAHCWKL